MTFINIRIKYKYYENNSHGIIWNKANILFFGVGSVRGREGRICYRIEGGEFHISYITRARKLWGGLLITR